MAGLCTVSCWDQMKQSKTKSISAGGYTESPIDDLRSTVLSTKTIISGSRKLADYRRHRYVYTSLIPTFIEQDAKYHPDGRI